MTKRLGRLGQRGDTIVEVMIVLAVLGLALSISYATANKGLQQSRNAQEHSQALGIINSQIELLRNAYAEQAGGSLPGVGVGFCLAPPDASHPSANPTLLGTGANGFKDNVTQDHMTTTAYPVPCTQDVFYHLSIVPRAGGVYDFRVRWDGISNLGRQQEELTYKISTLSIGAGGYTDPEIPVVPALNVQLTANGSTGPVSISPGASGASVNMAWSVVGAPPFTSCTATGPSGWAGARGESGTYTYHAGAVATPTTLTFKLDCTKSDNGAAGSAAVVVVVNPSTYTYNGNQYTNCVSDGGSCYLSGSSVYSCWAYSAYYAASTKGVVAGSYNLTLHVGNGGYGVCGGYAAPSGFVYQVNVYVDGAFRGTASISASSGTGTINIGTVNAGSTIQLYWTNDQWDGASIYDANMMINSFTLTNRGS